MVAMLLLIGFRPVERPIRVVGEIVFGICGVGAQRVFVNWFNCSPCCCKAIAECEPEILRDSPRHFSPVTLGTRLELIVSLPGSDEDD